MIIAVDFDGVIHKYSKGWHDGTIYDPPIEGCANVLQSLIDSGHDIVIYSARVVTRKTEDGIDHVQLEQVKQWLAQYEIPYHSIWTGRGKMTADLYIDDRAIRFNGNWQETFEEIKNK